MTACAFLKWRRAGGCILVLCYVLSHAGAADAVEGTPDAPPASGCATRVLAEFGWRIEPRPGRGFNVQAGSPCQRHDFDHAHRAGDLHIELDPDRWSPEQLDQSLQSLFEHPATLCAYAIQLGEATRRAVDRLAANPGYRFSGLQTGWIGFGFGGPSIDGWQPIRSFGRGFVPARGNWRAIEGFYRGRVRSECGVGRQIAQYAALAELFGPAGFDAEFDRDEIVIGTFRQLHGTRSVLLGSSAGEFVRDGLAQRASAMGQQGFSGLPGFVVHSFDASFLDDINNQAQNFVVYEVEAAAADALRRQQGFAHFNAINHRIWEIARRIDAPGRRGFERLLIDREARAIAGLGEAERRDLAAIEALLDNPFHRGFRIYVHDFGVRPVGWHIVRLLDRNPRTPFQVELALHNLHTTLYRRYLRYRLATCEGQSEG
jgi:hypothetical protein